MEETTLYAIPNSHPCATVEKALQLKRIPYRRVELAPIYHRAVQRLRFGRPSVPGVKLPDGAKLVGSREIMHRLEGLSPEPPLFPADPDRRAAVEEAERWGEEVLQDATRRIEVRALTASSAQVIAPTATGSRMFGIPLPDLWIRLNARPGARISAAIYGADEDSVRAALKALPGQLDKVDGWIADGVIGGQEPNAADLQIASSMRALVSLADLRPLLADRPAAQLGERIFPFWRVSVPAGALPAEWLPRS